MALTKVQAEGVNLADNFAFTGTVSGSGMNLLLSNTISSAVAQYDISSTYINSTYDSYIIYATLLPASDNVFLKSRVFVGGSIQTGTIYGAEAGDNASSNYMNNNADDSMKMQTDTVGNATGEGGTWFISLHNVNNTDRPFAYFGDLHKYSTSGTSASSTIGGGLNVANRGSVVNGYRFFFNSGNIASGAVRVYGIRT